MKQATKSYFYKMYIKVDEVDLRRKVWSFLFLSVHIFYFRREHVNRQISAFWANFCFRRKSKCKQGQKNLNWRKQSDFSLHGQRINMGICRVLNLWTKTSESIWLSFYISILYNVQWYVHIWYMNSLRHFEFFSVASDQRIKGTE